MVIYTLLSDIRHHLFRPISKSQRDLLKDYVSKEETEEGKSTLRSVFDMPIDEFTKVALRVSFDRVPLSNVFFDACVFLRVAEIETNSALPMLQTRSLHWEPYLNRSGRSSVQCYSMGTSFLAVAFVGNPKVYVYSYRDTGFCGTEYMKTCAVKGYDLGKCTVKFFRDHRGFSTLRR